MTNDPDCKEFGYIVLSCGRTEQNKECTTTEEVFKWFHETEALPFMKKVQEGKQRNSNNINDSSTFTIDSDIPYLKYLNRPEIRDIHEKNNITITNVAATGTHCYQYNDLSDCFKLASTNSNHYPTQTILRN